MPFFACHLEHDMYHNDQYMILTANNLTDAKRQAKEYAEDLAGTWI